MDRRPLSPASLSKCENLLMRLAQFYKYHGINIKTCYADFDKHHIGVVTESQVGTNNYRPFVDPALKIRNPLTLFFLEQFYRSFPGSPDVTAEETVLLAKKYRDHTRPGLCNYYSFHEDIERKQNGKNMDLSNLFISPLIGTLSNYDYDCSENINKKINLLPLNFIASI